MQCPRCEATDLLPVSKFCYQCGLQLPRAPSRQKVVDVGPKPNEDQSVAETKTHSGEGKVFASPLLKNG